VTELLVILPFALSLLVKLISITLLPKVMLRSLEDLTSVPGLASHKAAFGDDQRRLIVNAVSNSGLKATATLTSLTSAFNSFVILSLKPSSSHLIALSIATAILLLLLAWMLPQSPQELSEKGPFGFQRATIVVLIFCGFDGFGAVVSLHG
jgi:H+/gluconate symporter-like permease